jgi:hypothetical protein
VKGAFSQPFLLCREDHNAAGFVTSFDRREVNLAPRIFVEKEAIVHTTTQNRGRNELDNVFAGDFHRALTVEQSGARAEV